MGDQQFRLALLARDTAVPATLGSLAERIASRWAALEDQDAETWRRDGRAAKCGGRDQIVSA
ncbi:hypothetical protein VTH82DRAFT_2268 [Thermothelomyces myriococcoides]